MIALTCISLCDFQYPLAGKNDMQSTSFAKMLTFTGLLAFQLLGLQAHSQSGQQYEADPLYGRVSIAHGGASQYLPFSSMPAFKAAISMAADYIETDVQLTKDGILICFHDLSLERSTNVEQVFPNRFAEISIDGAAAKTWYTNDFTLAEIKQLDYGSSFAAEFSKEHIVSFQELIDIAKGKVGLYPETKDSTFYHGRGLNIDLALHELFVENDLHTQQGQQGQQGTPIVIQSFSESSLKKLRELGGDNYALLQLVWPTQDIDYMSNAGLAHVATYADGIGPYLSAVLPPNLDRIEAAHNEGLWIHVWQSTEKFPPSGYTSQSYMRYLMDTLGIDGVMNHEPDKFPQP
jgi:glycerophosphoryl diester phosphodiesterase